MTPPLAPLVLGPASGTCIAWRQGGRSFVTAIAKATFALVPGAPMTIAEPAPICAREVHHDGRLTCSIAAPSDLAPFRPGVDVVFVGSGHAPGGVAVRELGVALRVVREGAVLLDKALRLSGERPSPQAAPTPFTVMPIRYERAFGGLGHRDNPLGVGADHETAAIAPNVAPADGSPGVTAGFGPIAASWPARRRLLAGLPLRRASGGGIELPDDFDARFYHAAPVDQRLAELRPGDWVVLEHLSRLRALLATQIPAVAAHAAVYRGQGAPALVRLSIDALLLDGEAGRASLVFRASWPVPADAPPPRVAIGLELPERPLVWPSPEAVARAAATPSWASPAAAPALAHPLASTAPLEPAAAERARRGSAAPFPLGGRRSHHPRIDVAGAPWSEADAAPPPPPHPRQSETLSATPEAGATAREIGYAREFLRAAARARRGGEGA